MNITLSWDLFVIVFFAIVVAYSFIIGKLESVKIIVATYIATVSVQGLGNILSRVTGESQPMFAIIGMGIDPTTFAVAKIITFIAITVFIAARGGLDIVYTRESGVILTTIFTGLFGFATAGLILSTLLTFVAGSPILSPTIMTSAAVAPFLEGSRLMRLMVENQDLWYTLPALLLVLVGFLGSVGADDE
jgi:hypothetical protein